MKTTYSNAVTLTHRRGSTLIIVLALLGLLAFTGMVFFTFAAQERAAAEYFSEGAKNEVDESDDPFPWALEQMLVGPSNLPQQKGSILWSPTQRHSIARNMIGRDIAPHTGTGMHVVLDSATGLPAIDNDFNGLKDGPPGGDPLDPMSDRLNFVDAIEAWGRTYGTAVEGTLNNRRDYLGTNAMPEPDVDYTYPDLNHLFLGMKCWAIRDNGVEEDTNLNGVLDGAETDLNGNGKLDRRYEQVRTIVPSFFRPQYLKSGTGKGANGVDVPTDPDWFNEKIDVAHQEYSVRSFRPHAFHISGFDSSGNPVLRFLDRTNPAHSAAIAALPGLSGEFPLRRGEGNAATQTNGPNFGKLGVWTGDGAASSTTFELDSDNDGDGIKEGIWLDLRYPLQETSDGRKYAVLHSFTIYDLDGLIDLNSHGNLAGLPRNATIDASIVGAGNLLGQTFLSQSNSGVGPHEISPLFAFAPRSSTLDTSTAFTDWYGANPSNRLEQANMEWAWILGGRIEGTNKTTAKPFDGRWGDASALWYHRFGAGSRYVSLLPRPGRAGNLSQSSSDVINNFGGAQGFDDNQDVLEGLASAVTGRYRGVVHPVDFSGRGRRTVSNDPRIPNMLKQNAALPDQWMQYTNYPLVGNAAGVADNTTYLAGKDGDITTTADNLLALTDTTNASNYNAGFEDPYEVVNDQDRAIRPDDQIFAIQDLVSAHLTKTDQDNATGLSDRLENLGPITFADNSSRSEMFTTLSSSFRHFAIAHDMTMRPWEWTADSDGDGFFEFPPKFGTVAEFTPVDPFRLQTRRLLFAEAFEGRGVQGQLPLSLNHILDVNRTVETPLEGTPEFISFMRRSGLRFRPLIEHPLATEVSGSGTARDSVTAIPTVVVGTALPTFPPKTIEDREFWARRDRQQLARDIYVLLYTIGGAQDNGGTVLNYTGTNSARTVYTEDRLRLMAQFAVNVVDAMDADNVITKFEFDKNLNDGWNLDDDAYTYSATSDPASAATTTATNVTRDGMYPDDAADRGVVYGIEAQQIAFSEVLGIRSKNTGDNDATPFDDSHGGTSGENDFLFAELQNMLPAPVTLGSGLTTGETAAKAIWRLVRMDRTAKAAAEQSLKEGSPTPPTHFVAFATVPRNVIDGGGRFTVSATNATGTKVVSSDFFVDIGAYDSMTNTYTGDFDGTYELIAPNCPNGTLPNKTMMTTDPAWSPRCDLDLVAHPTACYQSASPLLASVGAYAGHTGLLDAATPIMKLEGTFASSIEGGGSLEGFDLVLQRRLNPDLPSISSEVQNPWIEVDRIRVSMTDFNIDAADDAARVRADADTDRLKKVLSTERKEPFQDSRNIHSNQGNLTARAFRSNSLKGDVNTAPDDTLGVNSLTAGGFNIWQPHFDREFVSSGELLQIPVFPPNLLTQKLNFSRLPAHQQLTLLSATPDVLNICNAAAMILMPDVTHDLAAPDVASVNDNRWYRLFQFVEVPSRVNRMVGNYINLKRIPGKLNPNTIRDREVYAGLLDDVQFLNTNPLSDVNGNGDIDGPFGLGIFADGDDVFQGIGSGRDRWLELINERDGSLVSVMDPTPLLPNSGDEIALNYWIPGAPNSKPFKSFNSRKPVGTDDNAIDSTLLRRLAFDRNVDSGVVNRSRNNVTGEGVTNYPVGHPNPPYNLVATSTPTTNRNWLEVGSSGYHTANSGGATATVVEHHQQLAKIMNNTTTVSNTFIMYGTAAYFEVYEDPATGLAQIGGRMGLDLDSDSDPKNDAGWEQRAVFIIDRTELYNAYDPGAGSIDWKRMVKSRTNLASDSK